MAGPGTARPSEQDIEIQDILTPTLQDLARQNLPLTLPWHPKETIKPGMLFSSFKADTDMPWSKLSPFTPESLRETTIRFSRANGDIASYRSQSTSSRIENNEHMSVSLTVSVNALIASVSVGGSYAKSVSKNTDANKTSVRSVFRSGTVLMDRVPSLTDEALIKLKYDGGIDAFKQTFGDYYVAGYRLGVDNGLFVSYDGFAERSSETKALEAKVKVLGIGKTHRESWTKSNQSSKQTIRFVAYDTLDHVMLDKSVQAAGSMDALEKDIDDMSEKAQNIEQRFVKRMEDLHIADGEALGYEALDRITKAGLVAELLLLPISFMREVLDWTVDDNILKL